MPLATPMTTQPTTIAGAASLLLCLASLGACGGDDTGASAEAGSEGSSGPSSASMGTTDDPTTPTGVDSTGVDPTGVDSTGTGSTTEDTGEPCPEICEVGSTRCEGPLVQTCEAAEGGCADWTVAEACDPGFECQEDACAFIPSSGFDDEESNWSIPDGGQNPGRGFWNIADVNGGQDEQTWTTIDLDGDGRLDLVVTARGEAATGGATAWGDPGDRFWRLYPGTDGGFETDWVEWSVPDGGQNPGRGFWSTADVNGGQDEQTWTTIDLDADGQLDLVVTARGEAATGGATAWGDPGSRYWQVHLNTGNGFDDVSMQWPIPDGGQNPGRGFWNIADVNGGQDEQTWTTIDIDADGQLDLVVTARGEAATGGATAWGDPGSRYWQVHLNTGNGFDNVSMQWSIPDGGQNPGRGFWNTADVNGGQDEETWSTIDLDADGRLDLVVTARGVVATGGATAWGNDGERHWRVFPGTDVGFEGVATQWSVPDGGQNPGRGFWNIADVNGGQDEQTWTTLDIDGDGRLDLVVTARGVVATGGATAWGVDGDRHWLVFLAADGGFEGISTQWPIPDGGQNPGRGFWNIADVNGGQDEQTWTTLDIDADGRLDLVVTARGVVATGGATAWGNAGSRFWQVFPSVF